jgi:predicted transcriptional regulator of viral defense system
MRLNQFFSKHSVFTLKDLDNYLCNHGSANLNTRKALLAYHKKKGRIVTVRRGLYAVVPYGVDPESFVADPFLIAAKMTKDSVLAYHTALEFYGKAYSVFNRLFYFSKQKSMPLHYYIHEIKQVRVPKSLRQKKNEMIGVESQERKGVTVKVTTFERTLVDMLDRPELTGSWEEVWRSLESIEYFDLDRVIEYVSLLENATTAAKVGYFLDKHRENLLLHDDDLKPLKQLSPKNPHYMVKKKQDAAKYIRDWNLIVPEEIHNTTWTDEI